MTKQSSKAMLHYSFTVLDMTSRSHELHTTLTPTVCSRGSKYLGLS